MVERYNGIEIDPNGAYVMFEDFERLTAEVSVTEIKRKVLWYALVEALQENGAGLGEAQIEADITMDRASGRQTEPSPSDRCPSCGYTQKDAEIHMDHKLCKNYGYFPHEKSTASGSQCQHIPIQPADTEDVKWGDTLLCGKCREVITADSRRDMADEYLEAETEHMADRATVDSRPTLIDPDGCEHGIPWDQDCGWCFQSENDPRSAEKGQDSNGNS